MWICRVYISCHRPFQDQVWPFSMWSRFHSQSVSDSLWLYSSVSYDGISDCRGEVFLYLTISFDAFVTAVYCFHSRDAHSGLFRVHSNQLWPQRGQLGTFKRNRWFDRSEKYIYLYHYMTAVWEFLHCEAFQFHMISHIFCCF